MSTCRKGVSSLFYTSLLLIGLSPLASQGQGLGNSPYTSQGIGELYGDNNIWNMGMGGIGVSNANGFHLNTSNPALLARNRNTVFEVGLLGQVKSIADQVQSQRDFGANLSYLALGFPVKNRWSMGISLRPYSFVDYNTTTYQRVPGTIYDSRSSYIGRGALNKATFTNGFHLGKNFYAGVEGAFLFGNATYDSESQLLINLIDDVIVTRSTQTTYSDVSWRLGAAWRPKLNKDWYLNVGATLEPQTKIRGRETDTYQQFLPGSGDTGAKTPLSLADTVRSNQGGRLTLPSKMRAGFSFEKALKLTVGVDVTYQQWSKYQTLSGQSGNLKDSYSVAAGLEFLPNVTSSNYLNLISYRLGAYYTQLPNVVNGKQLTDMGGSLGFSLPVGRFVNSITLSVMAGQRGVLTDNQIRERYGKIGLSLSLNDRWFQRYKVD
ncbi:hypothetical protein [Tellurirhabdus bombi]|uniref:hypothetical protein n=1 Tax=Tellurirhabdus bombi TaxID=2907205 RepID=UPI001F2ED7F7|nr:hypothetical protein [Tellurirhabdus bombi]